MKPRTKDRWLTAATVAGILALGIVPGCGGEAPHSHRIDQPLAPCTTDTECMEQHGGDGGPEPKAPWSEIEGLKRPL